jgi:hypothetical protein
MKQIPYTLRFRGTAVPSDPKGTILEARTKADSCSITTTVSESGVQGVVAVVAGGEAQFESRVMITGESTFQERGTITFGAGNRIHFGTIGEGYLGTSPNPALKHGTVMWKVERGEGQLEGVTGLITSNFTVGDKGEVDDCHFGILFVK